MSVSATELMRWLIQKVFTTFMKHDNGKGQCITRRLFPQTFTFSWSNTPMGQRNGESNVHAPCLSTYILIIAANINSRCGSVVAMSCLVRMHAYGLSRGSLNPEREIGKRGGKSMDWRMATVRSNMWVHAFALLLYVAAGRLSDLRYEKRISSKVLR